MICSIPLAYVGGPTMAVDRPTINRLAPADRAGERVTMTRWRIEVDPAPALARVDPAVALIAR